MKRAKQRSELKQFWIHVGGEKGFQEILKNVAMKQFRRAFRQHLGLPAEPPPTPRR